MIEQQGEGLEQLVACHLSVALGAGRIFSLARPGGRHLVVEPQQLFADRLGAVLVALCQPGAEQEREHPVELVEGELAVDFGRQARRAGDNGEPVVEIRDLRVVAAQRREIAVDLRGKFGIGGLAIREQRRVLRIDARAARLVAADLGVEPEARLVDIIAMAVHRGEPVGGRADGDRIRLGQILGDSKARRQGERGEREQPA